MTDSLTTVARVRPSRSKAAIAERAAAAAALATAPIADLEPAVILDGSPEPVGFSRVQDGIQTTDTRRVSAASLQTAVAMLAAAAAPHNLDDVLADFPDGHLHQPLMPIRRGNPAARARRKAERRNRRRGQGR